MLVSCFLLVSPKFDTLLSEIIWNQGRWRFDGMVKGEGGGRSRGNLISRQEKVN